MTQGLYHPVRRAVPRLVAALCLMGIMGGVALCMVQGGGAKAGRLADAAQAYYARAQQGELPYESAAYLRVAARETLLQSLQYDPARAESWFLLSEILLRQQAFGPAEVALTMAENLDFGGVAQAQHFAANPDAAPPGPGRP